MAKRKGKYSVGNHTHKGMVRKVNQDSFGSVKTAWGDLYVVADGMGGHKGGETASKLTVTLLCDEFKNNQVKNPTKFLTEKLVLADEVVRKKADDDNKLKGMGTTVVAVIIKNNKAYYAHVGDSRIYLFRNKKGTQLTKDHSYVQQLVDQGLIKPEEAENHPQKNKILQAIGIGNVKPSSDTTDLYKNDFLLLCSDGLSGEVNKEEMWSFIESSSPMESCKNLVNLANKRGGPDNSTVIIIQINQGLKAPKGLPKDKEEEKSNTQRFAMVAAGIMAVIVIVAVYLNKDKLPGGSGTGSVTTAADTTAADTTAADTTEEVDKAEKTEEVDKAEKTEEVDKAEKTEEVDAPKEDDKYTSIGDGKYILKTDMGPDGKAKPDTPTFTKDNSGNFIQAIEDQEKKSDKNPDTTKKKK